MVFAHLAIALSFSLYLSICVLKSRVPFFLKVIVLRAQRGFDHGTQMVLSEVNIVGRRNVVNVTKYDQ